MAYVPKLFRITAQTNLHAGSGDQNFGIIDNLIQRDTVSYLPVIHGSSLKGALREFFTLELDKKDHDLINYVFGKETTKDDQGNQAGNYRFFDAHLLSMPVRSNARPFFRTTSPLILEQLTDLLKQIAHNLDAESQAVLSAFAKPENGFLMHTEQGLAESRRPVLLEDYDKVANYNAQIEPLTALAGKPLAVVDNQAFRELCDDNHLPVIARNSLENGRSTNLWYEQVLPRQSLFYTLIMVPDHDQNHFDAFEKHLLGPQLKQIGANASIGYGFCQFESIPITPIAITA